jgi:rubrerythrin
MGKEQPREVTLIRTALGGFLGLSLLYLSVLALYPVITGSEIWVWRCDDCGLEFWMSTPLGFMASMECPFCHSMNTRRLFRIF